MHNHLHLVIVHCISALNYHTIPYKYVVITISIIAILGIKKRVLYQQAVSSTPLVYLFLRQGLSMLPMLALNLKFSSLSLSSSVHHHAQLVQLSHVN